jgi:predicted alpha/beta-hydrolase family hydrolase
MSPVSRPCSEQRLVTTPAGDARLIVDRAPRRARATLVLGHGAGGGAGARDLVALAEALPAAGFTVVRVEQPWRVAGKRVAPAPATLDRGWLGALAHVKVTGALLVGGRSVGARVACRTALALGAAGCVALAFPLHPPGRTGRPFDPTRSRLPELIAAGVPTLVVQGERDAFGGPEELQASRRSLSADTVVVGIPGADHGFAVLRGGRGTQGQVLDRLVTSVRDWCLTLC